MNILVEKLMKRIQATTGKLEITINEPKKEPIDNKLVIEPMPEVKEEQCPISKENKDKS